MAERTIISAFSPEQVALLTGLTHHQLSYWDRAGFFRPRARVADGVPARVYDLTDVVGLRVISRLRREFGIALQQLRRVADVVAQHAEKPWASLKFSVSKGEVAFIEPTTGRARTALTGQYVLIDLLDERKAVEQAVVDFRQRDRSELGATARRRNVAHNAEVFAGTRIPRRVVERFVAAGYDDRRIMDEYPTLTPADIALVRDRAPRSA